LVFYLFSETIAILYYGDGFFSRSPPVSSERMSEEKGAEIIAITSTPDSPPGPDGWFKPNQQERINASRKAILQNRMKSSTVTASY